MSLIGYYLTEDPTIGVCAPCSRRLSLDETRITHVSDGDRIPASAEFLESKPDLAKMLDKSPSVAIAFVCSSCGSFVSS